MYIINIIKNNICKIKLVIFARISNINLVSKNDEKKTI